METRKLVKTGAETYTLSLPKDWVKKNKLNKGDLLFVTRQGDKLEITPTEKAEEKEEKEVTITIDDKELNTIRRETISAYINNFSTLIFTGKSLGVKLQDIRKVLHNFLALEVIEQTESRMVVKDYLDLREFSFDNIIRRMDMLVRSQMIDSKISFTDKGAHENIKIKDYEVDKLFFLINRLLRSREMEPRQAITYFWLAKTLESLGDDIKDVSEDFESVKEKGIKEKYDEVEEYYKEAMKAYQKKDKELADKVIGRKEKLAREIDKIKEKTIATKLKNIVSNSRNVAKIALDS